MRVIARATLSEFVKDRVAKHQQTLVKAHLDSWYKAAAEALWKNSAEVKTQFGSASVLTSERVVFNIKGNDYRLIVTIDYYYKIVLIKWLGTHEEYDKIDARKVEYDEDRYYDSAH